MTIQGSSQAISVHRLTTMELPEFARLWTVHTSYLSFILVVVLRLNNTPKHLLQMALVLLSLH